MGNINNIELSIDELDEIIKKLTTADTNVDQKRKAFEKEFESDKVLESLLGRLRQ